MRKGGHTSIPEALRACIVSNFLAVAMTFQPLERRCLTVATPKELGSEHPVTRATRCRLFVVDIVVFDGVMSVVLAGKVMECG
jgi:hypothetical protein